MPQAARPFCCMAELTGIAAARCWAIRGSFAIIAGLFRDLSWPTTPLIRQVSPARIGVCAELDSPFPTCRLVAFVAVSAKLLAGRTFDSQAHAGPSFAWQALVAALHDFGLGQIPASSVHLEHMLPAVLGIADQFSAPRVYHQVEILQRNLAHEHRDRVGHFQDVRRGSRGLRSSTAPPRIYRPRKCLGWWRPASSPLVQPQLADQPRGQREDRRPRVH